MSNITHIIDLQKSQLNAFQAVSQALFNASEQFINLNLTTAKSAFETAAQSSQTLLGARDPQEILGLSASVNQPALEKLVEYSRHAYGIAAGTHGELSKVVEAQIAENNRKLSEFVDFASQHAPAGSESAVSLFKSAMATANTAFDTATKAARQASDWAESNFAQAANATLNAATAAHDSVKAIKGHKAA